LLKLVETKGDKKLMYEIIKNFKPTFPISSSPSSLKNLLVDAPLNNNELKWDNIRCGTGISFETNKTLVFLKEQSYVFRSVITSTGFSSGIHYWEIVADNRT